MKKPFRKVFRLFDICIEGITQVNQQLEKRYIHLKIYCSCNCRDGNNDDWPSDRGHHRYYCKQTNSGSCGEMQCPKEDQSPMCLYLRKPVIYHGKSRLLRTVYQLFKLKPEAFQQVINRAIDARVYLPEYISSHLVWSRRRAWEL